MARRRYYPEHAIAALRVYQERHGVSARISTWDQERLRLPATVVWDGTNPSLLPAPSSATIRNMFGGSWNAALAATGLPKVTGKELPEPRPHICDVCAAEVFIPSHYLCGTCRLTLMILMPVK